MSLEFVITVGLGIINFLGMIVLWLVAFIAKGTFTQNCLALAAVNATIKDNKKEHESEFSRLWGSLKHSEETAEQWKLAETANFTRMEVTVSRLEGMLTTAVTEMRSDVRSLLLEFPVFRTELAALKKQNSDMARQFAATMKLLGRIVVDEDDDEGHPGDVQEFIDGLNKQGVKK